MRPTDAVLETFRVANNSGDTVRLIQAGSAFNQALIEDAGAPIPGGALALTILGVRIRSNHYVPENMAVLQNGAGEVVGVIQL